MASDESRRVEILPDHVANQIAAGEVVERPASAVKELVENALDAGATRVDVVLRSGGKSEVRVIDDGHGMDPQDAVLALDRHATSKIRVAEDLHAVSSFGFRGEALPAIAAVSRFELHTSTTEGEGTRIRVESGRIRGVDESPRRRGTTVTVRSLFHDVPARAKFLRAAAAETRAASEALLHLALAHPTVAFRMESNGRELLHLAPTARLDERVAAIWPDLADTLIPLDAPDGGLRVSGLIQRPDAARPRGGKRYSFINGRPFRDPGLTRLVDDAYRTTVQEGMHPSFFLFLDMPSDRVDVNVHPAKIEVRFRDRAVVEEAVREAVREALGRLDSARPLDPGRPGLSVGSPEVGRRLGRPAAAGHRQTMPQLALFVPDRPSSAEGSGASAVSDAAREARPEDDALDSLGSTDTARLQLWQLHNRYILASTRDGLLIIDQHSAHERVLFEEVMHRFAEGGDAQRLLFPVTLRLSPAEAAAVDELAGLLRRIGFEIEAFGDRTFILHASPQPHPRFDAELCLRAMIEELTEGSPLVNSARNQHERIAKSMACKGAIKAGQPLSSHEMNELFDRLFATELPGHDVHGRPTIIRLSIDELDRRFRRA
jgi:DNA mismatch repair protein MutL